MSGDLRLLSTNTCWYSLCDPHSLLTVTFLTGSHCSFQRKDSINLTSIVSVGYHVTRRTYAKHCWRNKEELMFETIFFLRPQLMNVPVLGYQQELICISSVWTVDVVWKILWERWMIETDGEIGRVRKIRADHVSWLYIYIYGERRERERERERERFNERKSLYACKGKKQKIPFLNDYGRGLRWWHSAFGK